MINIIVGILCALPFGILILFWDDFNIDTLEDDQERFFKRNNWDN